MRMRFKPYAHKELMAADFHVHDPFAVSYTHLTLPTNREV